MIHLHPFKSSACGLFDRLLDFGLDRFGVLPVGGLPELLSNQIRLFDPCKIEGRLVGVTDGAVWRKDADELVGLIENSFKLGFTLPQGTFGRLLIGDVEPGAYDELDPAIRPACDGIGPLNQPASGNGEFPSKRTRFQHPGALYGGGPGARSGP
jgi:hypothetical protein